MFSLLNVLFSEDVFQHFAADVWNIKKKKGAAGKTHAEWRWCCSNIGVFFSERAKDNLLETGKSIALYWIAETPGVCIDVLGGHLALETRMFPVQYQ